MPKFNRYIQLKTGEKIAKTDNPQHPLFGQYAINFTDFENGKLSKEANENDTVDIILLPDCQLKAILPDGREFRYG